MRTLSPLSLCIILSLGLVACGPAGDDPFEDGSGDGSGDGDGTGGDGDGSGDGTGDGTGDPNDGYDTSECDDIKDSDPELWAALCDENGDGSTDDDGPIIIVDENDPDDPDDDEPIISVDPRPDDGSNPISFLTDGLLPPNAGCMIANAAAGPLGLPDPPPGYNCGMLDVFDPNSDPSTWPSCRQCMASAVQKLRQGQGTVGQCKVSKATRIAADNRFVLAGQEPNFAQSAFLTALDSPARYVLAGASAAAVVAGATFLIPGVNVIGLGAAAVIAGGVAIFTAVFEPEVDCPPELKGLADGEVRPKWDDLLYKTDGHCGTLCEADEPVSCYDDDNACSGLFYVAASGGSSPDDYTLQSGPGTGSDTVRVECTTTRLGASEDAQNVAELDLCCPVEDLGGTSCNRLYSLAED